MASLNGVLKKMHDERAILRWEGAWKNPWDYRREGSNISYFSEHDKPEGSTEILGYVGSYDEFVIKSGTLIVGRDSRFQTIANGYRSVRKGATLALMDGAMTAHANTSHGLFIDAGGSLTGGLPDRPLKRDARAGYLHANWMNTKFRPWNKLNGKVIGYPAKGSDARLVICWQRNELPMPGRQLNDKNWCRQYSESLRKCPPKIGVQVADGTQLENIRFEDMHRGGLWVPSIDVFKTWKNVTFGAGCLSKDPKDMLRTKDMPERKEWFTL